MVLILKWKDVLQNNLNSLYSYGAQHKVKLGTSKNKTMHFTRSINNINRRNTMQIYYGNSSLEWVDELKCLGLRIKRNNTFGCALGIYVN